MSFCWRHPSLLAIEVGWRWFFGVPFLMLAWRLAQEILLRVPPSVAGLNRLDAQNPWVSSVLLADAAGRYQPLVADALRWLAPAALVVWAVVSGLGRGLLLWRMRTLDGRSDGSVSFLRRLPGLIALQGVWGLALAGCFWLWYSAVAWASATHITAAIEPDLIGYLCWLIFLSLGLFILWAVSSWTLAMAPLLYVQENCSVAQALGRSFRLGREFSGKLAEVNLVMAIVRITLIVLAMVFCAAPLPFSDQFGPDFMHLLYVVIAIAFLIGNDYFAVVRMKSSLSLWQHYRSLEVQREVTFAPTTKIDPYADLQQQFVHSILDVEWAFLSDESSLWDFQSELSLEHSYERIRDVYGVDVSDIEGALIWKILKRISDRR
jgi:hypothetical protein